MLTRPQKYVTIIIRTIILNAKYFLQSRCFLKLYLKVLVLRGHIRLSDWWQLFSLWLLRREYERD